MSMFPIATAAGTGGAGSFNFLSIPQTFTHLQLRMIARDYIAANAVYHYFNFDSAGTSYSQHYLMGDGATAFATGASNQPYFAMDGATASTDLANANGALIIDVLDYSNTNKFKTIRVSAGWDLNGSGRVWQWSGLWRNTNAITSWILTPGFSTTSRADLYGISTSFRTGA